MVFFYELWTKKSEILLEFHFVLVLKIFKKASSFLP